MPSENVHAVDETHDGRPKRGIADFLGVPHKFCLLGFGSWDLSAEEWYLTGIVPDHDLYELVPVAHPSKPKIVRHGHFSQRKSSEGLQPNHACSWQAVEWKPLSIQERLDRIGKAQRVAGPEFGLPKYTPFLVGRFYLNDKDLDEIRPLLKDDPEKPKVGQVGRYRGIAVFPLSSRPVVPSDEELAIAEYEGVFYGYCEMNHVFG